LYLAHKIVDRQAHFFIRESYRDGEIFRSRDLFNLGPDPAGYIVYPGGNSFYVDSAVEDGLSSAGRKTTPDELDDLFWVFLKPQIKRALASFRDREKTWRKSERNTGARPAGTYHLFDRRRLFFLRTGRAHVTNFRSIPPGFFSAIDQKSRDEIEQNFIRMEYALHPHQLKPYVFSIFNLQSFFTEVYARATPYLLDQLKVDQCFVDVLCSLNDDRDFWSGSVKECRLHEYLVRYAIMFFDYDYEPRNPMQDYLRNFMNRHREHRPPPRRSFVSLREAGTIFNVDKTELKQMSRRDLARLYRRRALKLHPDKGGGTDEFIKLTDAYHSLLRRKT
jgi:hypothetical protein